MVSTIARGTVLRYTVRRTLAVLCVAALALGGPEMLVGRAQQPAAQPAEAAKMPADQLDSLVAPIALYPDPLLAQVLAASTYPLEIVQLQQFLTKNPNLKDQPLVDAVMKQPWDPTVQSLAAVPEVVKRLADDIQWTTDLGNAVLAQESDVFDAVQRMRKKAEDKGALKSDDKMTVQTKPEGGESVIVIEQANPQVVYVPSYDPTYVYGAAVYPYPPIYYPPYYAGGLFLSFGIGVAMGAAWGGWCCGAGWGGGGNNININNENNFVRNSERNSQRQNGNRGQNGNRSGDRGGNTWQHNPQHRGGTPYSDRATADRFGGTTRGDSRGNSGPTGGLGQSGRTGGPGQGGRQPNSGRGQGPGGQGGPGKAGVSDRAGPSLQTGPGGGKAADRVGGQNVSRTGGGNGDALGGGPRGGYNGSNAGRSSNRGSSSMGGGRSGGGGARGGGGGGRSGGGGGGRGGRR